MHETVGKTQLTYMVSATMALNIGSVYAPQAVREIHSILSKPVRR